MDQVCAHWGFLGRSPRPLANTAVVLTLAKERKSDSYFSRWLKHVKTTNQSINGGFFMGTMPVFMGIYWGYGFNQLDPPELPSEESLVYH